MYVLSIHSPPALNAREYFAWYTTACLNGFQVSQVMDATAGPWRHNWTTLGYIASLVIDMLNLFFSTSDPWPFWKKVVDRRPVNWCTIKCLHCIYIVFVVRVHNTYITGQSRFWTLSLTILTSSYFWYYISFQVNGNSRSS